MLLDKGIDVNAKDKHGWTALMAGAEGGHRTATRALLKKGANINAEDEYGWTALMRAASEGHLETVKILLDGGADVSDKRQTWLDCPDVGCGERSREGG